MTVFYKCGNQRKPVGEVSKVQLKRWTSENMKGVGQCMLVPLPGVPWYTSGFCTAKGFLPACQAIQTRGVDQIADERTFVSI
jgi:hypothetical protein